MIQVQSGLYIFLAFLMGFVMSIYLPLNGLVSKHVGSSITANLSFFTIAFFTSALVFFLFGDFKSLSHIKDVPIYLYLTGFAGSMIVLGTTFLIPRIGARSFFIVLIAGQILMAMVVSHYGIFSSPEDPISIKKIAGAIFVIVGAIISTY